MGIFLIFFTIIMLLIAAVSDLRSYRIPNWLTYTTMIVGIAYHTGTKGQEGFLFSVEGLGIGIGILIIPYLMGGMGAGDAKLLGAVGALLGPKSVLMVFLLTAIVGGIYALVLLTLHGYTGEIGKRYIRMLKTFLFTKKLIYIPSPEREKKPKLCYGVAIALGTLVSVVWGINI